MILFKRFLAEGIDRTTANHYLRIAQLGLERMYCPDPENHIDMWRSGAIEHRERSENHRLAWSSSDESISCWQQQAMCQVHRE